MFAFKVKAYNMQDKENKKRNRAEKQLHKLTDKIIAGLSKYDHLEVVMKRPALFNWDTMEYTLQEINKVIPITWEMDDDAKITIDKKEKQDEI